MKIMVFLEKNKEKEGEIIIIDSIHLILNEEAGEIFEEINETRALMIEEFERVHLEKTRTYHEEIKKEKQIYEEIYEEKMKKSNEENMKSKQDLADFLEEMIEGRKKLMEMNKLEKENLIVTDMIFDIVRNWTDIDFVFSQILGMREAMKNTIITNIGEENLKKNTEKIIRRMQNRFDILLKLYESNEEILEKVLSSINDFLDFVELGKTESYRTGMITALNFMRNVPFRSFEIGECIDQETGRIVEIRDSMEEIREILFMLPLCQLRPRRSIRQLLWEEVDLCQDINDISLNLKSLQIK